MFCKNCGGENANNAKFCKFCGTTLMPDFNEQPANGGFQNTYESYPNQNYYDANAQNYTAQPAQPEAKSGKANPLSIVGMILGAISLLSWVVCDGSLYVLFFTGLPIAIVGLILSKKSKLTGSNIFNKLGTIFSIIGIPLNIILGIIELVNILL